jgi:hypothetical protein
VRQKPITGTHRLPDEFAQQDSKYLAPAKQLIIG